MLATPEAYRCLAQQARHRFQQHLTLDRTAGSVATANGARVSKASV